MDKVKLPADCSILTCLTRDAVVPSFYKCRTAGVGYPENRAALINHLPSTKTLCVVEFSLLIVIPTTVPQSTDSPAWGV